MGHNGPKPHTWPVEGWRKYCPTVGDMWGMEWIIYNQCPTCGLRMLVNLSVVVEVKGPKYVLWGRTPRCKRVGCKGRSYFESCPPGAQQTFKLAAVTPAMGYPSGRHR